MTTLNEDGIAPAAGEEAEGPSLSEQEGMEGLEGMEIDADMAALLAKLSDEEEAPPAAAETAPPMARGQIASSPFAASPAMPSLSSAESQREAPPTVSSAQFMPFDQAASTPATNNIDLIMEVALRVTVELGRTTMSIREVLELGPGSVVELDRLAGEPVDILVNDHLIARGEVMVVDESFGVRVTEIITAAKRLASLR